MKQGVYIQNISVLGPGINSWQQLQLIVQGKAEHALTPIDKLAPNILPANERRRTTQFIKLALYVAEQACLYKEEAKTYASVFAASDGDYEILDKNTHALTLPGHPVSPTFFHNSVHNAASGYWAIAAKAQAFSTSLSAGSATFSAGLLEALTFCTVEAQPVLYVAYDYPPYNILSSVRNVQYPFAVGMVMQPVQDNDSISNLQLFESKTDTETGMDLPTMEALRRDNPVAYALPLLQAIARNARTTCSIPAVNNTLLNVEVTPCQ